MMLLWGVGPCTLEKLEGAVRAAAIELDQETHRKLNEIFPAPDGLHLVTVRSIALQRPAT